MDSGGDAYAWVATGANGAGSWVTVWRSYDDLTGTIGTDADILVASSKNAGATWTAPVALNSTAGSDAGDDRHPHVTVDGAGNWLAVWHSYDDLAGTIGADSDILLARSRDAGATWSDPTVLNDNAATDSGKDEIALVVTDGAGHWVAAWQSKDDLQGTIGTDWDILVVQSADGGTTWTSPTALNSGAATDSGGDFRVRIETDKAGNWVAVWDSYDDAGGTIGADADILAATSTTGGAGWTTGRALNTNSANDFGDDQVPQLATDGSGQWMAIWQSTDDLAGTIGTDYDILLATSTSKGAT